MEKIVIENDITVFGLQVINFPQGIGETFDALVKKLPGGFNRSYYGISSLVNGQMIYYATAEESFAGEAEKYHCDRLTIEKGEYLAEPIINWRSKTDSIKNVFHEMMKNEAADNTRPAVEWYKNEEEMYCMVSMKRPAFS